jgi:hypothetical protein
MPNDPDIAAARTTTRDPLATLTDAVAVHLAAAGGPHLTPDIHMTPEADPGAPTEVAQGSADVPLMKPSDSSAGEAHGDL